MDSQINICILTVSDRSFQGLREDLTGPALKMTIEAAGWKVVKTAIVPDEQSEIEAFLISTIENDGADLILTAGGTGFAPRDVTPEATLAVVERSAPGIAEAIRADSLKITPHGMLSRGMAGIYQKTLIVNLSGSPNAAVEQFEVIAPVIPHAISLLREDPDSEKGHQKLTRSARS